MENEKIINDHKLEVRLTMQDELVIDSALKLSLIELIFGTGLHAFKIPLSGHFLSLNQGLFCLFFSRNLETRWTKARFIFDVSIVSALMKSLAPTFKKIGPMLSIAMQGNLLAIGILIGGGGYFGQTIGMLLLSLWAFIQPLLSFFALYGFDFIRAIEYFNQKVISSLGINPNILYYVLAVIISMKFILAGLIPFIIKAKSFENYISKCYMKISRDSGSLKRSPRNMKFNRFLYVLSFIFMVSYFSLIGESFTFILWKISRVVLLTFLFFLITRCSRIQSLIGRLSEKSEKLRRLVLLAKMTVRKINKE